MTRKLKDTKVAEFKPFLLLPTNKGNGLSIGTLIEVTVDKTKKEKTDSKRVNFRDREIPYLNLIFRNHQTNTDDDERQHICQLKAYDPGSVTDDKFKDMEWNRMSTAIFHMIKIFRGGEEPTDEEYSKIGDLNDELVGDALIAEFKRYFTGIADFFNKGNKGKPLYKASDYHKGQLNDDGFAIIWMKLLLYKNNRIVNQQGQSAMPGFNLPVDSDGIIEIYINGKSPGMTIRPSRNEYITERENKPADQGSNQMANVDPERLADDL